VVGGGRAQRGKVGGGRAQRGKVAAVDCPLVYLEPPCVIDVSPSTAVR
jgi:hypothetical protein